MERTIPSEDLALAIDAFVRVTNALLRARAERDGNRFVSEIYAEDGLRYVRIWMRDVGSQSSSRGSAYCFIDKKGGTVDKKPSQVGDILKPDGWKKPAGGKRGNVLDASWVGATGPYGVGYLTCPNYAFGADQTTYGVIKDAILDRKIDAAVAVAEQALPKKEAS